MFFGPSKIVLYLKGNSLEIYRKSSAATEKLEFPATVVNHLEVLDHAALEKLLTDFVHKLNLKKQHAILLLSDGVTFHKKLLASEIEKDQTVVQKFIDALPFDPSFVIQKLVKDSKDTHLIATNHDYFASVAQGLQKNFWQIEAVAPLTLFLPSDEKTVLTYDQIKKALKKKELLKLGSFMSKDDHKGVILREGSDSTHENPTEKKGVHDFAKLALLVCFLFTAAFAGYFFYKERDSVIPAFHLALLRVKDTTQRLPKSSNSGASGVKLISSSSASPSATTSAAAKTASGSARSSTGSAVPILKENLKIQLLNGSGIKGQATTIKTQLLALGFKTVEIGNSLTLNEATTIKFAPGVTPTAKDELTTFLSQTSQNLNIEDQPEGGLFDVVITTGVQ